MTFVPGPEKTSRATWKPTRANGRFGIRCYLWRGLPLVGGCRRPFLSAPRQDTDLLGATVSRALRHGHRAMQVAMATTPFFYFLTSRTFVQFNCASAGLLVSWFASTSNKVIFVTSYSFYRFSQFLQCHLELDPNVISFSGSFFSI